MTDELPRIPIPTPDADQTEKMVFLQEQIVNFLRQYSMPLIEVSLVFSKYTRQLTEALTVQANAEGEKLPEILTQPWPLLGGNENSESSGPPLETVLQNLDDDRMDILDTILRSSMVATEMPLADALMQLRQWEHLARNQLADSKATGQLFSPLEIPEEW
tara:strand:- start:2257 stop:2736 length:480 start_codon:yes stop_codon:yes gene_type:complete